MGIGRLLIRVVTAVATVVASTVVALVVTAPTVQAAPGSGVGLASIYGTLSDGRLTYSVIDPVTGNRTHVVVSTARLGFTAKALATLDFNTLLVTSTAGRLYRVDVITNNTSLAFDTPVDLGGGWTHDLLAFDGLTHLFGIASGTLRRYTIANTGPDHPTASDITAYTTIDTGFTLTTLTATGPDWILGLTSSGVLRSYHIFGAGSWSGWTLDSQFCCFTHLISPGGGVYYGRTSGGAMYRYLDLDQFDGSGADIQYFGSDPVDLSGWTQTTLSAQPGSVAPPRWDGFRPVLFLHGYATDGQQNCAGIWNDAITYYDGLGYDRSDLRTIKYYTADDNCDLDGTIGLTANQNTPIQELGRRLAWTIFYEYSMLGRTVDAIGHSMGGLIIRAAITGTRNPPSGQAWPPYIYVEDVSTLATPHDGSSAIDGTGPLFDECANDPITGNHDNTQCRDMLPGSTFIEWLQAHQNVQANGSGTDWTLIGSGDDGIPCCVRSDSALDIHASSHAGHKILYLSGQDLEHSDLPSATTGSYQQRVCHFWTSCNMAYTDTWTLTTGNAPIARAADGNRYSTTF